MVEIYFADTARFFTIPLISVNCNRMNFISYFVICWLLVGFDMSPVWCCGIQWSTVVSKNGDAIFIRGLTVHNEIWIHVIELLAVHNKTKSHLLRYNLYWVTFFFFHISRFRPILPWRNLSYCRPPRIFERCIHGIKKNMLEFRSRRYEPFHDHPLLRSEWKQHIHNPP